MIAYHPKLESCTDYKCHPYNIDYKGFKVNYKILPDAGTDGLPKNMAKRDRISKPGTEGKVATSFLPKADTGSGIIHSYRDELGRFTDGNEGLSKRYTNPDALRDDVLKYLERIRDEKKNPTMAGLALALGFRSRRSLLSYATETGYEQFHEIIQFAKMKIEEYLEERLLDHRNTNVAGLIFNLKNNFDWMDKQDIRMEQRSLTLMGFNFKHPAGEDNVTG